MKSVANENLAEYVYICKKIEKKRHIVCETVTDCI